MKKICFLLAAAALLAAVLTGCGHVEPAAPEPSAVTIPDKAGDTDEIGDLDLLPAVYAKNLLGLADTATGSGISYSILDVQRTKAFGSRTLENLIDLSRGGMDEHGNLLGDDDYLFLTIQFTNHTDQTVEIQRNQGGLRAINSEGQVLYYDSETVYCDQKWDGGIPGEVFHWVLAPSESVTSEIGWVVWGWDETSKALLKGDQDWSLYYEVEASDNRAENFFIALDREAE